MSFETVDLTDCLIIASSSLQSVSFTWRDSDCRGLIDGDDNVVNARATAHMLWNHEECGRRVHGCGGVGPNRLHLC